MRRDGGAAAGGRPGHCGIVLFIAIWSMFACAGQPPDGGVHTAPVEAEAERDPPIARSETDWPHLTVEVLEARRASRGTLELRLAFVNTSANGEEVPFGHHFASEPGDENTIADVFLVDPLAQRKYFVLRDPDDRAQCSSGLDNLRPGERRELWALFPAPPPEVDSIVIHIPHVPPVGRVPIS
jgi:hypothetical protein